MVITTDMISRYPFFADLSQEQIAVLASVAEGITAQIGDYIFHEGRRTLLFLHRCRGCSRRSSRIPSSGRPRKERRCPIQRNRAWGCLCMVSLGSTSQSNSKHESTKPLLAGQL
jgi:hypothetical protein